ncbi:hypothetical protein RF11_05202 [Thelohanellus kitauei]|uniref:Uncharacterized protein n=1 Tax=Thelohanellus kitauei TaxID=669202 RepID=A0A0C2J0I8_THEKT|nr:hypothetical protein RF11_05202 [Thelohanellus kitauei]
MLPDIQQSITSKNEDSEDGTEISSASRAPSLGRVARRVMGAFRWRFLTAAAKSRAYACKTELPWYDREELMDLGSLPQGLKNPPESAVSLLLEYDHLLLPRR